MILWVKSYKDQTEYTVIMAYPLMLVSMRISIGGN